MSFKSLRTYFKKKDILQRAADAWQKNETKLALELYDDLLKIDPNNSEALFWMGVLLDQKGKYHESIQSLERAKILKPEDYQISYLLGIVYLKTDQYKLALINCEMALRTLKTKRVSESKQYFDVKFDLFYNMAMVYMNLSDYEKAIEFADKALSVSPQNKQADNLKMSAYQLMTAKK